MNGEQLAFYFMGAGVGLLLARVFQLKQTQMVIPGLIVLFAGFVMLFVHIRSTL